MIWFFLWLFACNSFAAVTDLLEIEVEFLAKQGDTRKAIKKQLIYNGVKSAFGDELEKLGLDQKVFWSKFQEELDLKFAPTKEKLEEAFAEKTQVKGQSFTEALRDKRLSFRLRHNPLMPAVQGFSIKRLSKSSVNRNKYLMTLSLRLDRGKVGDIYFSKVFGQTEGSIKSIGLALNLSVDKNLSEVYPALAPYTMKNTIANSWKNFITDAPNNISEVMVLDNWHKNSSSDSEADSTIVLDVFFHFEKIGHDPFKDVVRIKLTGGHRLLDVATKRVLHQSDHEEELSLSGKFDKQVLSTLAGKVHSAQLPHWKSLGKHLYAKLLQKKKFQIEFPTEIKTQDLMQVVDFINSSGRAYSLWGGVESLRKEGLICGFEFYGKESNITGLFKRLSGKTIGNRYQLTIEGQMPSFVAKVLVNEPETSL